MAAAARGARVIERHFTLDKSWKGSDHRCSLDPVELSLMCHHLKQKAEFLRLKEVFNKDEMNEINESVANTCKKVLESEQSCISKLGKTLVARRDIPPNTIISSKVRRTKLSFLS